MLGANKLPLRQGFGLYPKRLDGVPDAAGPVGRIFRL